MFLHVKRNPAQPGTLQSVFAMSTFAPTLDFDTQLMLRAQKNDDASFGMLVDRHRTTLVQHLSRLVRNPAVADELAQDVFLRVHRSREKWEPSAKFSTWLFRIALNTAISDLRKQRRHITSVDPENLPTQLQDIQYNTEKEEQLQSLYAAINRLTEVEKALTMLYLEDKSYSEMEEILGISQNNLRVKMNRIKEKLRKMTKEAVYGIGNA